LLFSQSMTKVAHEQLMRFLMLPVPSAVAIAVAAGFAEEIEERGFVLDRLRTATGSTALAATATLALALAAHIPFSGWRYAVVLGPSQLILILFYLWRKSLWPNIIAHTMIDCTSVLSRIALLAAASLLGGMNYHQLLGDFRCRFRDYTGAISEYSQALAAAPGDAHLLSSRPHAEIMKHRYAQAIADLGLALQKKPGNPDYTIQKAMAFTTPGTTRKANARRIRRSQLLRATPICTVNGRLSKDGWTSRTRRSPI